MLSQRVIRRENTHYITLRADILAVFGWHRPTAYVCQALINWDTHQMNYLYRNGKKGQPWVRLKVATIRDTCLGAVSDKTIREALHRLHDIGVIDIRDNTNELGGEYLLNADALNRLLSALDDDGMKTPEPTPRMEEPSGSFTEASVAPVVLPKGSGSFTEPPSGSFTGVEINTIGREINRETEYSHLVGPARESSACTSNDLPGAQAETADSSLPSPTVRKATSIPTPPPSPLPAANNQQTSCEDVDTGGEPMDVRTFVSSYRRLIRGSKQVPKADQRYVEEWLDGAGSGFGCEYLQSCLEGFGKDEYARAKGFPVRLFLSCPSRYYSAAQEEAVSDWSNIGVSKGMPKQQEAVWDAATAWNEAVKYADKVALSIRKNPGYDSFNRHATVRQQWDTLIDKADRLVQGGCNWLTLMWLLKTADGRTKANWERVLDGEFDFKLPKKSLEQLADEGLEALYAELGITGDDENGSDEGKRTGE